MAAQASAAFNNPREVRMPDYILAWDKVAENYVVSLDIAPDEGVSVTGILRVTTDGVQGAEQQLGYSALVPKWSRTVGATESFHLTVTFGFHTKAISAAKLTATCRRPDGAIYDGPPYDEVYEGQHEVIADVYIQVNR
jgi:hypothetical protein